MLVWSLNAENQPHIQMQFNGFFPVFMKTSLEPNAQQATNKLYDEAFSFLILSISSVCVRVFSVFLEF